MPNLGDFLGLVLSEITIARMHADLETVRIAELYSSHPLLKYMPAPHFRMPDVEVDIPVAIKGADDPRPAESPRGGARLDDLRRRFDQLLDSELAKTNQPVAPADRARIGAALDAALLKARGPSDTAVDVNRMADEFTDVATRAVVDVRRTPVPEHFARDLRTAARLEFLKARSAPPRLAALFTSAEVREAGGPEQIARLRLKISEQGLEWATLDSDGSPRERLVPE